MQPVFTTDGLHPKNSFQIWREVLFERLVPIEIERLDDRPFAGKMEVASVGSLNMSRVTQGALRSETTPNAARHHDRAGMAVVLFKLAGLSPFPDPVPLGHEVEIGEENVCVEHF